MKIQTILRIPLLLLVSLVCACAGTSGPKIETPESVTAGLKALQKGNLLYARGCYPQASTHFFNAHVLFTAADDPPGIALSLNGIGNVYQMDGDAENAIAFFNEALAINAQAGDRQAGLQTLANKAAALIDSGQLEAAAVLIETAGNNPAEPFLPLLINRGILQIKQQAYHQAQASLASALARADAHDTASRARIHVALGSLMDLTGNTTATIEHFSKALEYDRIIGFYKGMANNLTYLGDAFQKQSAPEKALTVYKRAAKLYALIGDRANVERLMDRLEPVARSTGADIRLTVHFVKTWLEDRHFEGPCQ